MHFAKWMIFAVFAGALLTELPTASANNLEAFIENKTDYTFKYSKKSGLVGKYPETIQPNSTSSNIDFTHHDGDGSGDITYQSSENSKCSFDLIINTYEEGGGSCSDKSYYLDPTDACSIKAIPLGCTDHGCKCTFQLISD